MRKLLFVFIPFFTSLSCSQQEEKLAEVPRINVIGKVFDDFKNQPIQNVLIYVYKPGSFFGTGYKLMAKTKTDLNGNYSISFEIGQFESGQGSYLITFGNPNDLFIFDYDNLEHYLTKGNNKIDFFIRKAKIFRTNITITNNIYGKMALYNGYATETQSIPMATTNTTLYFKADPKGPNIFQMYVHEPDGHYWWKSELKECQGINDTIDIQINADINNFKRYNFNQNPGS